MRYVLFIHSLFKVLECIEQGQFSKILAQHKMNIFTIIMFKKYLLIIILFISFSTHTIAQSDYYYYKGEKIPLIANEDKVGICIQKKRKDTRERILAKVNVLNQIIDDYYDIFIIFRSELEKLISCDFWKEDSKSVILTPSFRTTNSTEVFVTPYLNLRLKTEQDIELLTSYAEKYELKMVKQDPLMPLWYILAITQDCDKNPLEYANLLWESGKFAEATPDFCSNDLACSLDLVSPNDLACFNDLTYPNDPLFNLQWGLHNGSFPNIDISACSAWNISTGKNVKIAIIDTGVDMNHIDLAANISNLSYDTETDTSPSILYGDHGTQCAGIAAAIKDNGIQIAGVAPEATIVSISNSMEGSTNSQLKRANGIIWAYQNDVDIISNSWRSTTYHAAIDEAIHDAFRYGRHGKGCIIVFAAGNGHGSGVDYPANSNDTIIAVSAIKNSGVLSLFSNYGPQLDLVAPGQYVLTTLPNDSIIYDEGTSLACPHVAGVAALILERNSELTVSQVNSILNSTAKKIPGVDFTIIKPDGLWNNKYGYGLVDAYSAVINTPCSVYIQNETITGTRTISADSIYVGKDVTDSKEHGNVTLGQGNITLKTGYLEIRNSTTIPLGTTLKIEK